MQSCIEGAPRPKPGPAHTVVQLGQGESIDGVILAEKVWGVLTHWNDGRGKKGRSERCCKESGYCSGCELELPSRWKGYLHVYCFRRKRALFVELTPATAEAIELMKPSGESVRGLRIRLKRGDGGKKTRIEVEILAYAGDLDALPAPQHPEEVLETLWKWK